MNGTLAQARTIARAVVKNFSAGDGIDLLLCPPFTALQAVSDILKGSPIALGGQDAYCEAEGAYTGEVSPLLLKDVGCSFCLVGHSERRHILGESDALIHKKLLALLKEDLHVILCVGETLQEREADTTWQVVEKQLETALHSVDASSALRHLVIAYEPVWAIGTGVNATPAQAQEVHRMIRTWLCDRFGVACGALLRIQYGGSVKPQNAASVLSQPDVDGALVGGASLNAKDFLEIIESALHAKGEKCSTA